MTKIAELTAEQESLLVVYRNRGIAEGLCTDRIDEDFARGYASRLMKALKRDHVATVCLGGPVETWYAVLMLTTGNQVWDQVQAQVGAQVWDQVRAQVGAQVGDQVQAQVQDQVGAQVRAQVWDQVQDQVQAQVQDQVGAQVGAQVQEQVWDQVRAQVGAQVGDQVQAQVQEQVQDQVGAQVGAQVRAQVQDQVRAQVRYVFPYLGGGIDYWSAWKSWSEYFRDVLAVDMCDISLLADCVKLGPTYPLENIVVICDRPSQIHMQDGLLHNEDGASWEYLDGTRGYSIRGVRVDEQIVMQPETQTIEQITGEPNAEVRRIRAERYGWHRYLADSGAKVIDSGDDIDGIHQALMEDQAGGRFLYVACPSSGRRYTMPVDESCETVQQGQHYLRGDGGALQGLELTSVRPGIYAQA